MKNSPAFTDVLAAAGQRAQACSEANLALKAGLGALEDVRQKVRERLTGLQEDESGMRDGLREALAVVGHLVGLTQSQVPVSEGQLMEARYTYSSLARLAEQGEAAGAEVDVLKKASA